MTDQSPQEPPRGRRARGSADPGPEYPGDLPRPPYPPPQYPGTVPGGRRRQAPGDSWAVQDYPAPPGRPGRLAGDAASGAGGTALPAEAAVGYGPRTPAGESSSGYGWTAAPPGGPHDPRRDAGGRDAGRGRERGPGRADPGRARVPVRGGKRQAAGQAMRAGRPGAGRTAAGSIMCSQHLAAGGTGGPRPLARSPAGRVALRPTPVPGVAGGLRRTRGPIVAGSTAVTLPDAGLPAGRRPGGSRKAARPPLRRGTGISAAPISWTGGRMATLSRTVTPEAVAGDVVCSAGAAVRPIQSLIMTPGAVTRGAAAARLTPWPRLGAERGAGGRRSAVPPAPPGSVLPGRPVLPGGPGVDGYLTAPPQQTLLDGPPSTQAGRPTQEPSAADWTSAPRRRGRHRPNLTPRRASAR